MRKKEEFSLILEINDYITYISIGCRRTKKSQLKIRKYFKGLKWKKENCLNRGKTRGYAVWLALELASDWLSL